MRISIQDIKAIRLSASDVLKGKLRFARRWLYCLALAGFACATVVSGTSFAQANSLNFGDNFFVTGDYVVAGAYGMTTKFSNGYAVGTFSIPDPNPGIHAAAFVPPGAEVVGAIVYWQTVENSTTKPGQPGTGTNGYFRPLIANGPPAPGYPITGVPLSGQNNVAWSSGGCSEPQAGKLTRTYRANVLGAFPQDSKGNIEANGEFEIRLPSIGPQTPLTLGATLVIIYRILSPTVPLNSIVIYDGAYGQTTASLNMTQTVQGFYDAAHSPVSKLTLIAGAGKSNKSQTVYLNNVALPSHAGRNEPPFPGYYGTWDNPTWTFGNPFYTEIANPVKEDAASATTEVVPGGSGGGCLSWGAVIVSTTVKNTSNDGLLDSWKKAGGYCDASINGGVCVNTDPSWVALPGAIVGKKDLFIQLDYMCSMVTALNTCQTGDGTNYSFNPPANAVTLITNAFSNPSHPVNLHINPPGTVQNVHAIQEQMCNDVGVGSANQALCPFPGQAGVVGWKGGYAYFKNQLVEPTGSVSNCDGANPAADCQPRFQHGRKDSWHYALFAHAVGRPEWKIQGGTLTSVVQTGNTVTFTTSTPLGTLTNGGYDNHSNPLPDPNCLNGRVSVYYASTNTNLNGTFCIATSTAPFGNTFTIAVPGPSESAHYTLSTDPYLSVAPGQTSSASGVSDVGGSDSLITLGLWGDPTSSASDGQQPNTIAGTFMHEIGHSLGLTHGGFYYDPQLPGSFVPTIEPNCKPNFQSIMNYYFQVDLLNGTLDYSEQQLDSLNEGKLPAGVTMNGKLPLYPSSKWYTPNPPQGVGASVTSHCDGTPRSLNDPVTFLVPGVADPASPGWATGGKQDVDFDGVITSSYPYLRGYNDWAPGGTFLTGTTTGVDLRQIGATANSAVFSQDNFFGGGQPLNGGGQPLNGGGQPLNGGGQPLNGGGQPLNGGGQPLNGGGQPLNGGGEIDQKTANSYTRPPTNLMAAEGASPRWITLNWTAPTFGQIGTYKVYRSTGGSAYSVIATITGNPPVTSYIDKTDNCTAAGYKYFATAVLANTTQESVPSNIISTIPPSTSLLTGCYNMGAISVPSSAVEGRTASITWSLQDDFYTTGTVVNNLFANTLVAIGPGGPTTLLSQGMVTAQGGASTFVFSNNQFTLNWDSDGLPSGSYTFELDLDSGQSETSSALQLQIDVTDTDDPQITTTALIAGTVGSPYSKTLVEEGGTGRITWSFGSGLPTGISNNPTGSATLSGTTCSAGTYNFTATVTDSATKPNSGTQALTLQIRQATTSTSVGSSWSTSIYGQPVTYTATVTPTYGCPMVGTVTFYDWGTQIGGAIPLTTGATVSTASYTPNLMQLTAGTHSITAVYTGDFNFYGSTSPIMVQTVYPQPLTATLTAASKTYDGTNTEPNAMSCSVAVVLPVDTVNCTATSGTFDGLNVGAHMVTATATISGVSAGNYTLGVALTSTPSTIVMAPASITPAPLTATVSGTESSAPPTFTVTGISYATFAGSDAESSPVNGTLSCAVVVPSGGAPSSTYPISCTGLSAANYDITYIYGSLSGIVAASPATLTVNVNGTLVPGTPNTFAIASYTVSGLLSPDTSAVVTGTLTCAVLAPDYSSNNYPISCSGLSVTGATNTYNIVYNYSYGTPNSPPPTPSSLTVAVNGSVKVGGTPTFTIHSITYSGFVNGDTPSVVSGTLSCTVAVPATALSKYPITCLGLTANNYNISYDYTNAANTTAARPSPLIVTVTGTPPSVTYSVSGLVNGDAPTVVNGTLSCTAGTADVAGNVPISCTGLSATNYNIAYSYSYLPGQDITSTQATLTVNVIGTVPHGSTDKVPTPPLTITSVTYSGFVNDDTLSAVTGALSCTTQPGPNAIPPSFVISGCSGITVPGYYAPIKYWFGKVTVAP